MVTDNRVYGQLALVSFKVKCEIFSKISLPDNIMCRESTLGIGLFEFEESVAIAITDRKCQNEGISVWILDDDSCWINKFIVRRPSQITKIVGYLKTGEFVGTNFDGYVFLYDSANNVVKDTQLKLYTPGTYNSRETRRTFKYSESLVNLNYSSRSLPKKGKDRQVILWIFPHFPHNRYIFAEGAVAVVAFLLQDLLSLKLFI